MSWQEIDFTQVAADNDVLPENVEFTFELLPGAKYSKYDPSRLEASAKVVEGEFAGRVSYFSYPDPSVQEWVRGVFVRMVRAAEANGFEGIETGEDPVEFLNRVAGTKFRASMKHRQYVSDGVEGTKADIKIGNIKPVAQ